MPTLYIEGGIISKFATNYKKALPNWKKVNKAIIKWRLFKKKLLQSTTSNSNLSRTRRNVHFPSDRFLYNFTLDNSNFR